MIVRNCPRVEEKDDAARLLDAAWTLQADSEYTASNPVVDGVRLIFRDGRLGPSETPDDLPVTVERRTLGPKVLHYLRRS